MGKKSKKTKSSNTGCTIKSDDRSTIINELKKVFDPENSDQESFIEPIVREFINDELDVDFNGNILLGGIIEDGTVDYRGNVWMGNVETDIEPPEEYELSVKELKTILKKLQE